ncbi:putative Metal ion binding protein [Tripterygium wilfordii]|uniref:Putative Metal ion binding protein n=1 Tax=Tripterygium wilfordii TaxID=458696 RepID=A0A7J7CF90_TRIWF|nr:heavy metal-associated isoprenylated plant protein 4 [Tripterygium wilfordii]KAF5732808.1 putative Metal ion binding protein [Tripterygium wilfordii]
MAEKKVKEIKADDEVITAVYKVNLHCQQCASEIKKPLMRIQGVYSVDADTEKGEIKVKGEIDAIKIHKLIEKWSQKNVELVSPKIKAKNTTITSGAGEKKEAIIRTMSVKVHMHCDKCENDLTKKLLKQKGIHSVKTDMKAQTLTVKGTIESDKLVAFMRKKVHKHVELVTEKKEEKKDKSSTEKPRIEAKSGEKNEITEYFKEEKKVEAAVITKEGATPYFIHYVYAPQLFSDENPNACIII